MKKITYIVYIGYILCFVLLSMLTVNSKVGLTAAGFTVLSVAVCLVLEFLQKSKETATSIGLISGQTIYIAIQTIFSLIIIFTNGGTVLSVSVVSCFLLVAFICIITVVHQATGIENRRNDINTAAMEFADNIIKKLDVCKSYTPNKQTQARLESLKDKIRFRKKATFMPSESFKNNLIEEIANLKSNLKDSADTQKSLNKLDEMINEWTLI
ncbi:MAG TPA: hypothetical protein DCG28_03550 [Lachnospiraceae bacterium]|nr:hypothetical protein [Lachnospiraceae bacterium]